MATTTNYEIDKTVKKTVGGGGRINRMSVSVVVDYKNVAGVSTARTADELTKIQNLVSAAVGIDQNRGDQVVVQTMDSCKSGLAGAVYTLSNTQGYSQTVGVQGASSPGGIGASATCPLQQGNCAGLAHGCVSFASASKYRAFCGSHWIAA